VEGRNFNTQHIHLSLDHSEVKWNCKLLL